MMQRRRAPAWASVPGWMAATLLCFAALHSPAVDFPLHWRWSNPAPHGNNIVGLAYSSSPPLGVQVTERGQIYTSDDLIFWVPRDSGTTANLRGVAFLGSRVIAVGETGTVLYADAPHSFQPGLLLDGPTGDWLEGVAASPTLALAVGDNGALYLSADGLSWKRRVTVHADWFKGVAFGNGGFVVVGDGGAVLTSPNGSNWTRRTSGTSQNLTRVAFANSRYTAVGAAGTVISSPNGGVSWVVETATVGATNHLHTASVGVSGRIVAGESEVHLQEPAGSWTNELAKTNGPPAWTYLSSLARPNYFLLGGRTGLLAEGYKTNSTPFYWLLSEDSVRSWFFDLFYATNLFVAVGDRATVMTSGDGVGWTLEFVPLPLTNTILLGVGGTTNLLVAAGNAGHLIVSPNMPTNFVVTNSAGVITNITTTLGVLWFPLPKFTTNDLQGVSAYPGGFVVTGDKGSVFTSSDGTNWSQQTTPTNKMLSSVAAFPGGLVATGDRGTILTSPDGVSWTLRPSATTNWLYRVRYLGGLLVAVGQNGVILTSTDGAVWTPRTNPSNKWLHDVAYAHGTWFAVGKQGAFLSSSNVIDWVDRGLITLKSLYGAATDHARLVTVGVEGIILRCRVVPDLTPIELLDYSRILPTNGQATIQNLFLFGGRTDQRFTLNSCAALGTNGWLDRQQLEILDGSGTLYYLETLFLTNTPPKEFFRATLTP